MGEGLNWHEHSKSYDVFLMVESFSLMLSCLLNITSP